MAETLTPAEAAARVERSDTHRSPTGDRPARSLLRRARRARRLGGAARLRGAAARQPEGPPAPQRPLPVGLLRPDRARAARPGRQHLVRARRLSPLRAAARGAVPAGDDDRRGAAQRRGLVQPLAARRRLDPRASPRRRGPRAAAASSRSRSASRRRSACRPTTSTPCTPTRSTCSSSPTRRPFPIEDPPPTDADRAIAEHAAAFIAEGATLQTGIGSVPSTLVSILAEGDGGDYGIHSEMFTTGLMRLHEAGKVTNRKGQFDGVSVATFAGGTEELYAWLNGNQDVAFLPVEVINNPDTIGRNRLMTTINGALAVDIEGQVVADTIDATQFSRHRRPRGLHLGPGAVARGAGAALPALDGDRERRASLADRALVRRRRRDHDPPPPGRPDRDRVRGGGAPGQDRPRPRRGARGDRPPAVPRRAARGGRARLRRPRAVPRAVG